MNNVNHKKVKIWKWHFYMLKVYQLNIIKKIKENYKIFLKRKKKKSNNMVVNVKKISQKMKNKSLLSIQKNIIEWEKMLYHNYKKVFKFRKICFFIFASLLLMFENFWLNKQNMSNFLLLGFKSSSWNVISFSFFKLRKLLPKI